MTRLKPSLSLNRLVITRRGALVYDQKFHSGVNIIRGTNSHGKSTVADFIFFALGGDLTKWKFEASTCDFVFAEIRANDAVLTLKREVRVERGQSMHVFFGNYDSASQSAATGWQVYPYKRTEQTESFSQVLFRALQMPDVSGEGSSNITMHQLLRLIYTDQMTAPDLLFRFEEFDSALIRRTVVDYFFGLYDNALYQEQLELREARKERDFTKEQQKQLEAALDKAEIDTDPVKLKADLEKLKKKLLEADGELAKAKDIEQSQRATQKAESGPVVEALSKTKREIYKVSNELQELALDIEDSEQFVASLEMRVVALDDSTIVRDVLGELPLIFCPQCLSALQKSTSESICSLCKQDVTGDATKQQAARMRQEIALQIKESKGLLTGKKQQHEKLATVNTRLREQLNLQQAEFERLTKTVQTRRDQKIDTLLVAKGTYERGIQDLLHKMKIVEVVQSLRNREKEIAKTIQDLEFSIRRRIDAQRERSAEAMAAFEKRTLFFLKHDLSLEEWFKLAQSVKIDPDNNTFSVDGRNQFSASSVTYLKNSTHFGILFASLDLEFFRYPRFLLCDNIEDKGMTVERSRNFQQTVVSLSKQAKVDHQIILTTSMVDPTLDTDEYCIGPKYIDGRKSLGIQAAVPLTPETSSPKP